MRIDFTIIFFVYGLAFFSLGLAMTLEAGRSPSLAAARVLRPLAVFGILHGLHEWVEMFLLAGVGLDVILPVELSWARIALLGVSFVSLIAYGIQVLRPPDAGKPLDVLVGGSLLGFYAVLVVYFESGGAASWVARSDTLARYLLGFPGAALAGLALYRQSRQARVESRTDLSALLRWTSWGFFLYGVSQLFVTPASLFPAHTLNADLFIRLVGMPIQVVRAGLAILVTFCLIRATQVVEGERQAELLAADRARLDALERVQEELVKREALRRDLLRHTVLAQEEERGRIARELHDGTAQTLTAFSLNLAALGKLVAGDARPMELVGQLQALSDQIADDIYRLVHHLRPAQLDDLGLSAALEYLVDSFREAFGLRIRFELHGTPMRLPRATETALFRVAQESLTNVARHACTTQAEMRLDYRPDLVCLEVQDDGVGFQLKEARKVRDGWGLVGMHERVAAVGGRLGVLSAPGEGTHVQVDIPVESLESIEYAGTADAVHTLDAGR